MPAVLAHWVVAKDVAWRFINNKVDGYELFQESQEDQFEQVSRYVYLGASGPDIPYFYDADPQDKILDIVRKSKWVDPQGEFKGTVGKSEWADLFHYNKQGEFILELLRVAKKNDDPERQQRTIAYALGHATHLAVDSIVHPYVNCFAGVSISERMLKN